jgi:hypothetical protein
MPLILNTSCVLNRMIAVNESALLPLNRLAAEGSLADPPSVGPAVIR